MEVKHKGMSSRMLLGSEGMPCKPAHMSSRTCLWCRMQEGSVRLAGVNVRELQQASLRSAVAVVPQDTVLFADSVLRNIRYGRPSASFEEIQTAAGA